MLPDSTDSKRPKNPFLTEKSTATSSIRYVITLACPVFFAQHALQIVCTSLLETCFVGDHVLCMMQS